jgi:hypothetical protein
MKQRQKLFVGLGLCVAALLGFAPSALLALPFLIGDTATTEDYTELMKIVFDDTVISETVYDTELMDFMPEGEVKQGPEGRWFETSQLYQSPGSWGSRGENGYIPEANSAKAENSRITLKKIVGSLEETAEVLKKIKRDKAAFLTWSDEQFPLFKEGLVDEMDRQLVGDGSGIRARVNEAVVANPVAVGSTLGIAGFDHELMQFRRGLRLRASPNIDGSAPRATAYTVDQLDWDNNALQLNSVADLVDGDYLFEGDAADNSAGKDMMGLLGLVDDGDIVQTLQNIDRNVHLWFRSYVRDLAGADLTEFAMIQTDRQARHRGGGKVDMIVMSDEAFDAVWTEIKADRVVNDPRAYTAGRKGITMLFGGTRTVEFRTARKLPSTLVFGLQKDVFRKFLLHEFQWDDTTGSLWRQVTDSTGRKDAFYAYGTAHGEIGIKSPQRCWRLEGFMSPAESIPAESV